MPILPALVALLAAAPPPAPVPLWLGGRTLPLQVALEVRAAPGSPDGAAGPEGPALDQDGPLPLAWATEPDGSLAGRGATPALAVEVRLSPAPGGAQRLEATLRWRRPSGLERAALRVGWPGAGPGAVGRDLAPAPLTSTRRTGRGTPLLAWAGPALLAGGPGVVAAAIGPGRGGIEVTLLLDDADERPFATYRACLPAMPRQDGLPGHGWADLEQKQPWRRAPRLAGDEDRLVATLYPRAPGDLGPLVPLRWARGVGAALVFTDHADRTDAGALRAVLFGHSDPRAEGSAGAGLLGRGLAVTRTFFASGGPGTLEDPEVARLADWLVAAGSEVGLHSVSERRDDREAVRAGLDASSRWAPAVWIDHQPYVNCEALSARGATSDRDFGVTDLLVEAGVRWGWAAGDVAGFKRVEVADLFQVAPPAAPSPVLYPLPGEPRLWIFQTAFFYAPPAELAAALSDDALERLERGQGLFVGHTYLGAGPAETRGAVAEARLAVRAAPGGGLAIDPALDAALARVARRVAAGTLASLTWTDAGDRLRALAGVELRYLPDGSAEVLNHGDRAVPGLTLLAPAAGLEWWVDGAPAEVAGRDRLWLDVPAGARRTVRATHRLVPVPLLTFSR